jgi:CDP-diacylglycerol--serine O-phosphatidyltransferase
MNWRPLIPNAITLCVLFLGVQSVLAAINEQFMRAAQFILLAGLLDGIDGEVARRVRGVTKFGGRLDSFVDTISFAMAPAVLVYQSAWRDYEPWGPIVAFAIVASGVLRFSRATVTRDRGRHHYFNGLPIPLSAMWMAMFILMSQSNSMAVREVMQHGALSAVMWLCALAFIVLQVSNVPYRKPGRDAVILGSTAVLVLMLFTGRPVAAAVIVYFVALFAYAFVSPFLTHEDLGEEEEDEAVAKGRF